MICPECSNVVSIKRNRCDRCGVDLTAYKKMYIISNRYYNEGLEKARVRDLSGAVLVLKNCLNINKRNTNARNLLGLIYYEMGETVAALNEWVVSKHFQAEDNDADEYINALQSNPTRLDTLNQTVKKYNSALLSAKQGSDDLAIIQLKKVTSLNPHFVKAWQLLALLYMKNNEEEKAVKCLNRAKKIDISNTITLRYLKELEDNSAPAREEGKAVNKETAVRSAEPAFFPMSTYKEDKPNIWAWVNLILGVVIGVFALFFLVVPTVKGHYVAEINKIKVAQDAELSKQTQEVSSLEKTNKELQDQVGKLQSQLEGYTAQTGEGTGYTSLLKASQLYLTALKENSNKIDYAPIAEELAKVNADALEDSSAKDLYDLIKKDTMIKAAEDLFDEGHNLYSQGKYEDALKPLTEANSYDPDNVDVIYFIGRSYHKMNDLENAKKYYTMLTDNYPDSSRASEAQSRLAGLE